MTSVIRGNDNFDSAQALPVLVTAQTAAGTSVDFIGIPSWAKRITISYNGVSTNGTSPVLVQIGSGAFETTGYLGSGSAIAGTVATSQFTTGFSFGQATQSAAFVRNGMTMLVLVSASVWSSSTTVGQSDQPQMLIGGGSKTITGTLDRVRITTVNGTDTFDAGSISIMYQ